MKDHEMIEDNLRTLDESRKWILQTEQTLQSAQTSLYDTMQQLHHLISEHKIAYDNAHDQTLTESDRMNAYNDSIKLRDDMNNTLNKWFEQYGEITF